MCNMSVGSMNRGLKFLYIALLKNGWEVKDVKKIEYVYRIVVGPKEEYKAFLSRVVELYETGI